MHRRRLVVVIVIVVALLAGGGIYAVRRPDREAGVSQPLEIQSMSGSVVGRFGQWEMTLAYPTGRLFSPWEDVKVNATFQTPSKTEVKARGFYYEADRYKLRFIPTEAGTYFYTVTVVGPSGLRSGTGSFDVSPSANPGFVRSSKTKPSRLVFDDGSPFNAIGINECLNDTDGNGKLDELMMDGGLRVPGQETDPGAATVDIETYLKAYGSAGFNLLRWNPGNCGFDVADRISVDGNRYLEREGKLGDQLLSAARAQGFRVMFTLFFQAPYPSAAQRPAEADAVRRYIDYAVARWGSAVDIWELTNETEPPADGANAPMHADAKPGSAPAQAGPPAHQRAPAQDTAPAPHEAASSSRVISDEWLRLVRDRVRANDPYRRMITNSNPRPSDSAMLDARSPHWYETEPAAESDLRTSQRVDWAGTGLPIIFGEQGNDGLNWDPESALRMRIRSWTAFFRQSVIVYWNLSFAKDCKCQGIYLGPQERSYVRAMQDFTTEAMGALEPTEVRPAGAGVRAYGLRSPETVAVYLHRFADSSAATAEIDLEVPFDGMVRWVEPATGKVMATQSLTRGRQRLTSPPFDVDAALRITRQ